ERGERAPVAALAARSEICDRGAEQEEVQQELHHPLAELRQALLRLDVEEADEVDEQERGEEDSDDRERARRATVPRERERDEEEEREDVADLDIAGDVPVDLFERAAERRRVEQELRRLREPRDGARRGGGSGDGGGCHRILRRRSASSSTRAARESRSRCAGSSFTDSSVPFRQRSCSSASASRSAAGSSGAATTPAPV